MGGGLIDGIAVGAPPLAAAPAPRLGLLSIHNILDSCDRRGRVVQNRRHRHHGTEILERILGLNVQVVESISLALCRTRHISPGHRGKIRRARLPIDHMAVAAGRDIATAPGPALRRRRLRVVRGPCDRRVFIIEKRRDTVDSRGNVSRRILGLNVEIVIPIATALGGGRRALKDNVGKGVGGIFRDHMPVGAGGLITVPGPALRSGGRRDHRQGSSRTGACCPALPTRSAQASCSLPRPWPERGDSRFRPHHSERRWRSHQRGPSRQTCRSDSGSPHGDSGSPSQPQDQLLGTGPAWILF